FQPGDGADTAQASAGGQALAGVMALVLELRQAVRAARDFAASDRIRDALTGAGITVKDAKDGAAWEGGADDALERVMALVLALRAEVRARKDFATSDRIRDGLAKAGIAVNDGKDGVTWTAAG
ncbi:MAG: hypothetical protein H0X38_14285, partial [Planctomycetes bacterium]|nr:hypothetical protein [Planctomycetota bacterium]